MQPPAFTVERLGAVPSTMDVARERARSGAPDGLVLVADSMTAGRGTHGRAWHAPPGGLYLSLVIRDLKDARLLTLALGNAVADVLEVAGAEPRLKWVNDVWLDGRKVAGILVEGESTGARLDFLVAGIGINVNGHAASFPPDLRETVTTLQDALGCDSCIPDIEAYLLQHIGIWLGRLRAGHSAEVVQRWRERDALRGTQVVVMEGEARIEGTAQGIDDDGRLRVATASGERTFATGTVRPAPSA